MESAAAKLRKTLRYPSDDNSDDSLPKTMDEQGYKGHRKDIAIRQKG